MACTGCAGANIIAIRMRIGGEEIMFRRCSKCEINRWSDDTGDISLDEVLELARVTR
jgi:hypothetical protein